MDMDRDSGFVGRLEVVETGRRRRWSVTEKIRIVEESLAGHRQASATARRHDIPNSLLFKWRRAYRDGSLGAAEPATSFIPAVVVPSEAAGQVAASPAGGRMEIVVSRDRRIIVGADVDGSALARVLGVLERR
ncbi:MAG: transposase [Alphaproteobacteria bacterium]|nr:transposase [Alphaproteobacteria bacterium]